MLPSNVEKEAKAIHKMAKEPGSAAWKVVVTVAKQEYPDHIRVDGIVYDLHFTADGDFTFCVISHGIDRWYGGTVRSPKDAPDVERGRKEAFKSAAGEVAQYHFLYAVRKSCGYHASEVVPHFRQAYWKACQKIKEQK